MSHWNHRLLKRDTKHGTIFGVYEVYYNSDGSIYAMTERPVELTGESPEDIEQEIQMILRALTTPVLDYDKTVAIVEKGIKEEEEELAFWDEFDEEGEWEEEDE